MDNKQHAILSPPRETAYREMTIRVLLADEHRIVREGVRALLEKERDIKVIAEASDGPTTVKLTENSSPDVVVMDIALPGLNGIEATRQIVTKCPGTKVLVLSTHSDRRFVVSILSAGASGYLRKDCASQELVKAIHNVAADQTYLSAKIADVVVKDYFHHLENAEPSAFSVLTLREREVLQLLAEGNSTNAVAQKLSLSIKTIETHRQQVMNKLHCHSIAELTKYAVREGLTSIDS